MSAALGGHMARRGASIAAWSTAPLVLGPPSAPSAAVAARACSAGASASVPLKPLQRLRGGSAKRLVEKPRPKPAAVSPRPLTTVVTNTQSLDCTDWNSSCALSAISDYAEKPMEKRSIADLLLMATLSPEERVVQLHETLKVGLARCALRLSEMPFGFCNAPSIRRVASAYVQNFRDVVEIERRLGEKGLHSQTYQDLTKSIFNQHRGTMLYVAKGVFEFCEDLSTVFGNGLELADARDEVKVLRDIEASLDDFFTNRLTLRLLISHVHGLNGAQDVCTSREQKMVGVVNVNASPIVILTRAYKSARFMCMRDFGIAPDLMVNGVHHLEYIEGRSLHQEFPYVHTHLFYIFLELMKNAARASVERMENEGSLGTCSAADVPPLYITVPEDMSLWNQERSVKLADGGTGMGRSVLTKAFCYFYSSVKARPTVADEVSDFDRRVPLAGFGFGLPISRVMARYFAGDIDINSIPGKGTDVYLYL
eukprot:TRINITY_DN46938_c0_g1_i1.p1 TRINITY_DN46938_c0_g1~~TRINITY_DN46938_c0_g1_i1.p1  ORF type:complete len:482 (-),score=91.60 TRINITY_DN46938_c0_g1_i1:138-1583(-)